VVLRRRGFEFAGGIAAVLAVAMTPVWSWAVLRLTGEWPDPLAYDNALARYDPYIASRLIVIELATIGVALLTLRRVRFFALAAPIAAAFVGVMLHLGWALGDPRLSWYIGPYYQCVIACVSFAIAYAVDRRQPRGEDYALWFYVAGAVMLGLGYVQVWSSIGAWRHALPLVAAALVIASLYLRRRVPRLPRVRRLPASHRAACRAGDARPPRDRRDRLDAAAFSGVGRAREPRRRRRRKGVADGSYRGPWTARDRGHGHALRRRGSRGAGGGAAMAGLALPASHEARSAHEQAPTTHRARFR
jgi:hypothetical protein